MTITLDRPSTPSATGHEDKLYYALEGWRGLVTKAVEPVNNVYVREDDTIRPLEHHIRHSPTGFAWGYGGSGPSDLARCILYDFLGFPPRPGVYQHFKGVFVSTWPQDEGWRLSGREIQEWLDLNYPDEDIEERIA